MGITIFEHANFEGRHEHFHEAVHCLGEHGFNDKISSVKIEGHPWVLYAHDNFEGEHLVLHEGHHHWIGHHFNDRISSMRPLHEHDHHHGHHHH